MKPSDTITGLLSPNARLDGPDGLVAVDLDQRKQVFLGDHLVGGRPLLSTVMGVETMACAAALARPGRSITAVADLRVLPPYLLPTNGIGTVWVSCPPPPHGEIAEMSCELHSRSAADSTTVHYRARFVSQPNSRPDSGFRTVPARPPGGPSVSSETIYRLFFHGPSFRVVDTAYYAAGLMVGVLRPKLPPAVRARRPSIMAPLLIELCLQTAGLWELAVLRRMMIPDAVERISRFTAIDVDHDVPLVALVSPRQSDHGRFVFDAQVVDPDGRVHLDVRGYRTTGFGHPVDGAAADAIQQALAGIPTPQPC